jgi:hypothetical protein
VRNILISVLDKKEKLPLSVTHPELAKEADGWNPSTNTAGSAKRVRWKCESGHSWECSPSSRINQNVNCAVCSGRHLLTGFNDFQTLYPELAKEAHGWDPKLENIWFRKVDWRCAEGHIYQALISSRITRDGGCAVCAGKKILIGYNDLKSLYPDIAAEANGWDPEEVTPGSSRRKSWKCKLGHIWETNPKHRTRRGDGCPTCAGKIVLPGFNDLASQRPDLVVEVDGWDASKFTVSSGVRQSWKCSLGHRWEIRIADRTYNDSKCPTCQGDTVLAGFNDLASKFPRIASEANGWDPSKVHFHSSKKLPWKCSLGHEWTSVVESRVLQDTNCLVCGNRQLLTGFNDIKTKFPEIAREANGWDPSTVMSGSNLQKWWICTSGHKWKARVADRTSQLTGCPTCTPGGFSPSEDGFLYFLQHISWNMFQIGITNNPDKRLGQHRKLGWEVLELRGPMDGHLTQQWETAILRMLKGKGADLSNSKIAGKFDGYSEAWSKSTFEVKSINELMRLTEEFEEGNPEN